MKFLSNRCATWGSVTAPFVVCSTMFHFFPKISTHSDSANILGALESPLEMFIN